MKPLFLNRCCWFLLLLGLAVPPAEQASATVVEIAAELVQSSGAPGGMCAIVGASDAELGVALAKQGSFVVQCLTPQADARDSMRKVIRSSGLYGTVSAETLSGSRLPYTDNLLNIVVVQNATLVDAGEIANEVVRVLAPLGTAYFAVASAEEGKQLEPLLNELGIEQTSIVEAGGRWLCARKPWPAAIDEWTHYLHGPDGNPVAKDTVIGPPKHYQWISGPMWQRSHETDSSISTLVTAGGRLFWIVDEAPISLAGNHPLPDKWFLEARDAFNGKTLWKVPIRRWGWREWKNSWFDTRPGDFPLNIQKRLVAAADKVYVTLGYQAPVSELDARTGKLLKTYAGTERTGEILYLDGTLFLSVLGDDDRLAVMAVDAESGRRLWTSEKRYRGSITDYIRFKEMNGGIEPPKLDPALNMATDGTSVALIDETEIACLDAKSGVERWHASFPTDEADHRAGGINADDRLWIGTMIVQDGVVLHSSPNRLAALSAERGELLWSQPKKYIGHLWYEWKDVFVIDGLVWTWSEELASDVFDLGRRGKQRTLAPSSVKGYDLHTGEVKREVPLGAVFKANHHHRCYRNKATSNYIIASRRGSEFIDLVDGQHSVNNWVRGTCHVGMMPANGLQYAPPHPCQCYVDEKLNAMNALAAARSSAGIEDDSPRLVQGPAFADETSDAAPPADAWPEFRHDAMRTGSVATQVPDDAEPLWRVHLGKKVSPSIIVGDRVYAALVDEHQIVALDAADGSVLWQFTAGARIDSPPTHHAGRLLFGSADGCVYSVRASDGRLAWQFRAAPERRLMGAFGQLESVWPVHGSVLVQNGTVYFVAGRSSQLDGGLFLYGLEAATGEVLHETNLEGPSYNVGDFEVNWQLPMGSLPDVLVGDGTNIFMRSNAFDAELNPQRGAPELRMGSGYLDDSYFKRMPWTFGGQYGRLIVHDNRQVYYVRMFDTLRGLDPTVYFTPGSKGYLLFAKNVGGKADTWTERIPIRIRSMVLTADRLIVAGPPDVIDSADPLGAFEGRKGGILSLIDSATGRAAAKIDLPSPPVFNGAAAAAGRLYVTEEDGTLTCFGK